MGLRIEIDRDLCMGSGSCVFEAPGAFALDADQIAIVEDAAGAPEEQVHEAARKCPTQAIDVREEAPAGG